MRNHWTDFIPLHVGIVEDCGDEENAWRALARDDCFDDCAELGIDPDEARKVVFLEVYPTSKRFEDQNDISWWLKHGDL